MEKMWKEKKKKKTSSRGNQIWHQRETCCEDIERSVLRCETIARHSSTTAKHGAMVRDCTFKRRMKKVNKWAHQSRSVKFQTVLGRKKMAEININ